MFFFLKTIRTEKSLGGYFLPEVSPWATFMRGKTALDGVDHLKTTDCREMVKGTTTQNGPKTNFSSFVGWHMSSPAFATAWVTCVSDFLLIKGGGAIKRILR